MIFELAKMATHQTYNLLNGLIAPRPIAWITSVNLAGTVNAAPFSAYNYVGTDPPLVAIGVGNRPGPGAVGKDTAQNIRNTREFVINVVNEALAQSMATCAVDFPPGVDELEIVRLRTVPSSIVSVPRIEESPASLECREVMTLEIGNARIILGQVVAIHIKDEFLDPTGPYIRAEQLHAIGRMNGLGAYVRTRDSFFHIPRMNYAQWVAQQKAQPAEKL